MKVIELNRPAIAMRLSAQELSIKPYVSLMMYMDKSKIIQQASPEKPVYRLAKDYEIDNVQFSLNLLTDKNDMKKAEKFMDKTAKSLSKDDVNNMLRKNQPFVYLDKEYGARK